jgi:hypothetical protein
MPDAAAARCLRANPDPLRHRVIEIPPVTPVVTDHRLRRLESPCCSPAPAPRCRQLWRPVTTAPGSVRWWVCWAVSSH